MDGIRVVELGEGWCGAALCGRILGELGAEVVKIESPAGDPLRRRPPLVDGVGHAFHFIAANKGSRALDLGTDSGVASLRQLALEADVLLDGYPKGNLDALGLGEGDLRSANPGLIYCAVSDFGRTGPLSEWAGAELLAQATSGMMATTGFPNSPPTRTGPALGQHAAAIMASTAVYAALIYRMRTGRGQFVDMAARDCIFDFHSSFLPSVLLDKVEPKRIGFKHTLLAPWDVFDLNDGRIVVCVGNDANWDALLRVIGREDLLGNPLYGTAEERVRRVEEINVFLQEWLRPHTMAEVIEKLEKAGVPCGAIVEVPHVLESPQFRARELLVEVAHPTRGKLPVAGSFIKMSRTPGRIRSCGPVLDCHRGQTFTPGDQPGNGRVTERPSRFPAGAGALSGVRVVEFDAFTLGPFCTEFLAQLGAEVIKVESMEGDYVRRLAHRVAGEGYLFHINNGGKRCVKIDVKRPKGRELALKLVSNADVLVENFAPGTMERLGLGYSAVSAINPRIVYCSLNGFGITGPMSNRKAYDTQVQGLTGIIATTGSAESGGVKVGASISDVLGAVSGTLAITAAVFHQRRTGEGQRVDVAMHDVSAYVTQEFWPNCLDGGEQLPRSGNRHALIGPQNSYRASDGSVAIAVENDKQWEALCRLMARADLAADPRFSNPFKRRQEADHLDGEIQRWIGNRTRDEVANRCQGAGVPAAPVLSMMEVVSHPLLAAREMVVEVEHPTAGRFRLLGSPYKLSETPGRVENPAEPLGASNGYVFGELLGVPAEELAALKRDGVI